MIAGTSCVGVFVPWEKCCNGKKKCLGHVFLPVYSVLIIDEMFLQASLGFVFNY